MAERERRPAPSYAEMMVGQLFVVILDREATPIDAMREHRRHHYGGVFLNATHLESIDRIRRLTHRFRRHTRDIPVPFIAIDEEGGMVTNISKVTTPAPSPMALGIGDDLERTEDVYYGIGEKLRALGFNTCFAPALDVNTEAANPVIGTRAFGATTESVTRHGKAALAGLRESGVATCIKHFPGHGETRTDSHLTLPKVDADRATLEGRELEPFRSVLEGSETAADMVMTAHVSYTAWDRSGNPATLSEPVIGGVLRKTLGYSGLVITDSMEMQGITDRVGP